MICSDEPGVYIEGSHGIRIENMILAKKGLKNEFGQFMEFEFLTWVPIDTECINLDLMEERDIEALNAYHREVYEKVAPLLEAEEQSWLAKACAPVGR